MLLYIFCLVGNDCTWKRRMIVQMSPRLRRGLPSTMSCEPMFSRCTLCSLKNCSALSTFSKQWMRILPLVGLGCNIIITKCLVLDNSTQLEIVHSNEILQRESTNFYYLRKTLSYFFQASSCLRKLNRRHQTCKLSQIWARSLPINSYKVLFTSYCTSLQEQIQIVSPRSMCKKCTDDSI